LGLVCSRASPEVIEMSPFWGWFVAGLRLRLLRCRRFGAGLLLFFN